MFQKKLHLKMQKVLLPQEFEEAFDYTETDDQLTAIREIKADMENPAPKKMPEVERELDRFL